MEAVLFMPLKNKIVEMKMEENSRVFNVKFGHVGQAMHTKSYPYSEWDRVYLEKISLGYIDQSNVYEKAEALSTHQITGISDLNEVLLHLKQVSKQLVEENYRMQDFSVTKEAIWKAETLLGRLESITDLWTFNETLMELFGLLPRKMDNVLLNLAKNPKDFFEITQREKELLQNLQANEDGRKCSGGDGLIYGKCSCGEIKKIREMLDPQTAAKFHKAWKVTNQDSRQKFDRYCREHHIQDTKLLFHGSRTENWWSILKLGLLKNPRNVNRQGSMFGAGIYFANKAAKSTGYTSIRDSYHVNGRDSKAYLALFEVAYGNPEHIYAWEDSYIYLTEKGFHDRYPEKHCLHAHRGADLVNDEIIVYNDKACTICYLIELQC